MALFKTFASLYALFALGSMLPVFAQVQGLPASDNLGAEDIWHNPSFVGGITNGGSTAHSEW